MVPVISLGLPILVAAGIVFVVSSIIHMVLPYHRADFAKVPSEDEVMESLRKYNLQPGDYVIPCAGSAQAMREADFIEKVTKGPVAFMTVVPNGPPSMGASLVLWFIYCVIVGVFCALVTGSALGRGAEYHSVFHLAALTAFCGYGLALLQDSIWYKRKWSTTLKNIFDGLIYALVTAATFGWLWPA